MLDFDNIENFVKDKLEGELLTAPKGEWDKISKQLKKKKKRNLWKLLFIDLGISLLFIVGVLNNYYQDINDNFHVSSSRSENHKQSELVKNSITISSIINNQKLAIKTNDSRLLINEKKYRAINSMAEQSPKLGVKLENVHLNTNKLAVGNEKFIESNSSSPFSKMSSIQNNIHLESSVFGQENRKEISHVKKAIPLSLSTLPFKKINSELKIVNSSIKKTNPRLKQLKERLSSTLSIGILAHELTTARQTDLDLKNQLNETHSQNFGSNFNLNLNFNLTRQLQIYSGLQIEQLSSKFSSSTSETYLTMVDTTFTYWDPATQSWATYIGPYEVEKNKSTPFSSTNKYTLISLPFGMNYYHALSKRYYVTGTLGGSVTLSGKYSGFTHTSN
ncbi:MAG: hypothetical protein MK066_04845, partial [Crocinitomicaceae bacterium]|nr:hypothetical protein [Crocinitomicaceae bacterium]